LDPAVMDRPDPPNLPIVAHQRFESRYPSYAARSGPEDGNVAGGAPPPGFRPQGRFPSHNFVGTVSKNGVCDFPSPKMGD